MVKEKMELLTLFIEFLFTINDDLIELVNTREPETVLFFIRK